MLADVGVRPVVQLTGRRQGVVAEDEAELAADLAVAGLALLPAGLDDRGRAGRRVFGQDLGEGAAIRIEDLERVEPAVGLRPLGADELAGELEEPFEEFDRVLRAFEAGPPQLLQPLREGPPDRMGSLASAPISSRTARPAPPLAS